MWFTCQTQPTNIAFLFHTLHTHIYSHMLINSHTHVLTEAQTHMLTHILQRAYTHSHSPPHHTHTLVCLFFLCFPSLEELKDYWLSVAFLLTQFLKIPLLMKSYCFWKMLPYRKSLPSLTVVNLLTLSEVLLWPKHQLFSEIALRWGREYYLEVGVKRKCLYIAFVTNE